MPPVLAVQANQHLLGLDRLCLLTGTVFGPGFAFSRTCRLLVLHAMFITSFLTAKSVGHDPKVSQLKKLANYFNLDIAELIEPRPSKQPDTTINNVIQDFIHFYYVERNQRIKYDQSPSQLGKALKKQFEAAFKAFLKDLDTLNHNPSSAERIFNKLLERSYQLSSDKDKFDDPAKIK